MSGGNILAGGAAGNAAPRPAAMAGKPADLSVDPWTAIILLFHEHEWESGILPWALASDAFFVGAMGGARTSERRQAEGVSEADMARLQGSVGLIPHVKDARTLGLSILAQVVEHYLDQIVPAER